MRLNFSGVGEDDIREGIRRIGEVVREQVELYGTLTGAAPKSAPRREAAPAEAPAPQARTAHVPANVLPLRRKRA
jgi:2-aminoadipate transaminase